jgi:hypothetical protein
MDLLNEKNEREAVYTELTFFLTDYEGILYTDRSKVKFDNGQIYIAQIAGGLSEKWKDLLGTHVPERDLEWINQQRACKFFIINF